MNINLEAAAKTIMLHGPSRVLISRDRAVPPSRAREEYGVIPDIVFIRDDGWSLGAAKELEDMAFSKWPCEWIGFLRRPDKIPVLIAHYQRHA